MWATYPKMQEALDLIEAWGFTYWSPATKETLVQRLAAYENTGLEPWEIGPAIEKAAKDAETATATKMAECIAGGIKDTVESIHRDPDGFFKGGAR